MRRLANITVLVFLILGSAICRAENDTIYHDFNALNGAGKIGYASSNTVGNVNDGEVVYTCSGTNCKFFTQYGGGSIAINLPDYNSEVVTTKFTNLKKIILTLVSPDVAVCENIKIHLSTDGDTFGAALSSGVTYNSGQIIATFPLGSYYVKISNIQSKRVSILTAKFISGRDCTNCLIYTP